MYSHQEVLIHHSIIPTPERINNCRIIPTKPRQPSVTDVDDSMLDVATPKDTLMAILEEGEHHTNLKENHVDVTCQSKSLVGSVGESASSYKKKIKDIDKL